MQKSIRIKILLVDDRENNLLSMETILWKDGYDIVRASSGKEALSILLKDFDFTLILMDVEMPGLNGFETATMIYAREKLRHIPIIFITAHSYGDENLFKGYKAGAVDYIYKPIQADLLRAKVAVFVELYKKNHQLIAQEQKLKTINKSLELEIKERKATEEQIHELNKQLLKNIEKLESSNKELDQFAFIASHDLQEPLRKIRTFSSHLLARYNDKLDDEGRMYMLKMQSACERMQNLITDILTFSKISVSKDARIITNMNHLLEEVVSDLDMQIQEKNAQITIEQLPEIAVYPGLIKPLFHNLFSNSLKYCKKNTPPVIHVSAKIESSSGTNNQSYCRIQVKDNGVGFEQKYAEQIFTMFKRLHGNSEYAGTGIGLAICKKIAEEHQGFISAFGTPDAGATFTLSLPYRASEPQKQVSAAGANEA
jgi:signal transduction histidine kinase